MIDYIIDDIKYFLDGLRRKIERAENASIAEDQQVEVTAQNAKQLADANAVLTKTNATLTKANAALKKRCEELEKRCKELESNGPTT